MESNNGSRMFSKKIGILKIHLHSSSFLLFFFFVIYNFEINAIITTGYIFRIINLHKGNACYTGFIYREPV